MKPRPRAKHLLSVAAVAVFLATAAACAGAKGPTREATSVSSQRTTTPAPRPSSNARTPRPTPSATKTTTRPWKVTLAKGDSCRILRAISPKRFHSSQGKIDPSGSLVFLGNTACARLSLTRLNDALWNDPGILLEVTAVEDRGLDEALESIDIKGLVDRRLTVDGFPALVVKSLPSGHGCNGFVDVADGQFVYVLLGQPFYADDKVIVPPATLCKKVPGVLAAVMDELKPTS